MEKTSFVELISELYTYFRYEKMPDKKTVDLWFSEVRNIPNHAIETIKINIKRLDSLPRNIPKHCKSGWNDFIKLNPKRIYKEYHECRFCRMGGYIFGKKMSDIGYVATYGFRCGHCENWKRDNAIGIPMSNVHELEKQGYRVIS